MGALKSESYQEPTLSSLAERVITIIFSAATNDKVDIMTTVGLSFTNAGYTPTHIENSMIGISLHIPRGSLHDAELKTWILAMMASSNGNPFPHYWPFVRGIHRSPVNSPHKGQWRGPLVFSFICAWINGWVNNHKASDMRRHRAHHNVTVMGNVKLGCQLPEPCQLSLSTEIYVIRLLKQSLLVQRTLIWGTPQTEQFL